MQPPEQLLLDLIEPEAPTLDNFVAGDNAELLGVLRRFQAGTAGQFLYLWGGAGVGKTHLLRALTPCQRWRVSPFDEATALYTVDNVARLDDEDLEKLFNLMNCVRAHPGTRICVAGAVAPQQLGIREDVVTRLTWGLVYRVQPLAGDAAQAEFIRLAQNRGLELAPEAIHWIGTWAPRDMAALKRYLDAVDRFAMRTKRRVTVPLLQACAAGPESCGIKG